MKKAILSLAVSITLASALNATDYYGTVNGEKITKTDVALVLQDPRIDFDKLPENAKKQVLDQIINKKLIAKNALASGIANNKEYKNALAKMKEDLAFQVWQKNELEKINISESQKKDFYNKNKKNFSVPGTLNARHILVKTEKEAKSIIKELNGASKKESKFIALAKTKSVGPSGKNGGNLGTFPENQMVPEFTKAAKSLSKNSYSKQPVKTKYGYHVIYLKDKKPAKQLSYDKVKGNISQIMLGNSYNKKAKALADKLRKNAKIVIK